MNFTIGWPQFIWFALTAVDIIIHIIHHGQRRNEEYDACTRLGGTILSALLLYWGGFFSGR